ncbi:hypothetical protein D9758_007888 [Tetrapyrgos nigripes]|uniref:Uncharacterized protein n=1 Tax=Tetrapyrgos nigripes TaxID=182062 RepID=A0A8H5D640_9AGAR|nr:hypothetical protein D9758_007888 [Tetrapyrgos nigripes]
MNELVIAVSRLRNLEKPCNPSSQPTPLNDVNDQVVHKRPHDQSFYLSVPPPCSKLQAVWLLAPILAINDYVLVLEWRPGHAAAFSAVYPCRPYFGAHSAVLEIYFAHLSMASLAARLLEITPPNHDATDACTLEMQRALANSWRAASLYLAWRATAGE